MNSTFRVGRIAGIDVGVNWTWFAIFGLIVWLWSQDVFPSENPGLSDNTYLAMAVVAAAAFFGSLLAHEFGHAVQAKRDGMEIEGITLWILGGVAKFKGQFPTAGAEFRIAIAGPLVSLVLGVAFLLVARAPLPEAVDGVVAWLGYLNIVLLVFNLLPALPLDGGRILRSTLWHFKRSFAAATRLAAGVGRAFGYAFIAAGLALIIFSGSFQGVWFAFIGWFILQAAGAEAQYASNTRNLDGLTFGDLMTRAPVSVPPHATVAQFMDLIAAQHRHATYPVVEQAKPLGLLVARSVLEVPRTQWETKTVGELMVPLSRVPVFEASAPAREALVGLAHDPIRRGLVLDDGRLVGVVSVQDLVRVLQEKQRAPLWRAFLPGRGRPD